MTLNRLGLLLLVLPILLLLGFYFAEWGDIRQCEMIDQGHWNYLTGQCSEEPFTLCTVDRPQPVVGQRGSVGVGHRPGLLHGGALSATPLRRQCWSLNTGALYRTRMPGAMPAPLPDPLP